VQGLRGYKRKLDFRPRRGALEDLRVNIFSGGTALFSLLLMMVRRSGVEWLDG
jgi:hypothetical protein